MPIRRLRLPLWSAVLAPVLAAGCAFGEPEAGLESPDAAVEAVPAAPTGGPSAAPATTGAAADAEAGATLQDLPPVVIPDHPPSFERPEHVRGLYLNAWTAGSSRRVAQLIELARATEINAFVIDIKDASGYVSHRTGVETAREIGATGEIRIADLPGLLWKLHEAGIYPIARIVIVKDPILIAARPELAVQDTAGGVWVDSKDFVWLNPYDRRVWDYHLELAREMAALGFPEIQWDYVRFPDAPASDMRRAVFPGDSLGSRADAIRAFLAHAREELDELGVDMTADVFGVTTTFRADVGIGQIWESFIDQVDAALPMVYPSHYWKGSYGFDRPNAHPYEVVKAALLDARARTHTVAGAGRVIPWLQDFTLGPPRYGAAEVRAQIQAAYDAGVHEWILWNPGSRYTEEALEPIGGFRAEPHMRLAGRVVPVSTRHEVLASRGGAQDESPLDSLRLDTVPAQMLRNDTLIRRDTGAARIDTIPADSGGVRRQR